MDWDSVRANAEVGGIRARSWLRVLIQVAGVALVLAGSFNLLVAPVIDTHALQALRVVDATIAMTNPRYIVHVADVTAIGAGAVLAWVT